MVGESITSRVLIVPKETVRVGPFCIGRLALLVEGVRRAVEDKPEVEEGITPLEPDVLGAVSRRKVPFDLQDDVFAYNEVWKILGVTLDTIAYLTVDRLVLVWYVHRIKHVCQALFGL